MEFSVIVASPIWSLNGVNVFSANLVRELQRQGISAHVLLTEPHISDSKPMKPPLDIKIQKLPVGEHDLYKTRWHRMVQYLEENAPCIYIPNHDINHSCIAPLLSKRVGIVGVVHSDDPQHYEHVGRLGKYWNSIVAVSKTVAKGTIERNPDLAERVVTIPIGVPIPHRPTERTYQADKPLKILYAGVFRQSQKRILDLPKIMQRLQALQIPTQLTIAGGGPDQQELVNASQTLVDQGVVQFVGIIPHDEMPDLLKQHDVFVMTSAFEGMPNALLEAMGQGCIPVVTDIDSGIPEIVKDGINGYRVSVGDIHIFAERLANLYRNISLRRELSIHAYRTVDQGSYRTTDMAELYIKLFYQVLRDAEEGIYQRPSDRIRPPDYMQPLWKHYLPEPIFRVGRWSKHILQNLIS
ncbi:glycosyltransferase family 4 protein [Thermocoleostomius sinensis]|uniref:Glycosyltransferase family 4 protein n=1 Tax=Thermocoleostomius sinensis A174 TaxID=2016057 RepID=A0A9E8ZAG4_9CYAN|nr:glycosyltransferase family 4 protein [Thermocoleostomius sinensis]WAL58379.1 glycosyltransferase family 4 protein [Thermocoleostomius sinensis A174]